MRGMLALVMLVSLGACSTTKTATFSCPNGPTLAVTMTDTTATVAFDNGRTEVIPKSPTSDGFYTKPGVSWTNTGFRSGRLGDGNSSYACDQTSV